MAVSEVVALPNIPASGGLTYTPLGGDGFAGPHSVYRGFVTGVGDASGGLISVQIRFDPRYTQLVLQLSAELQGITADANVDMQISDDVNGQQSVRRIAPYAPLAGTATDAKVNWNPPPYLVSAGIGADSDRPRILVRSLNAGVGTDLVVRFHIYNFDKRAREIVPVEILSRALIRAESIT